MNLCSLFGDVNMTQDDTTEDEGDECDEGKVEYKVECHANFVVSKNKLINAQMSDEKLKVL